MASADLRAELDCSICMSTYTDPVMLSCGHNFCQACIGRLLDTQYQSGVYSCPECRAKFLERPVPMRNIELQNIMEKFLFTQPTRMEASGDEHLEVHKSPEDVLSDPSTDPDDRKCFVHKKTLVYYCTKDATYICTDCSAQEHQGHLMETLEEASEKRKVTLRSLHQTLSKKKQEMEMMIQSLGEYTRKIQEKASAEAEKVTDLFTDIRKQLNRQEIKILSVISQKKMEDSHKFFSLINQQEIKKAELSMKMRRFKELCNMTDPLTVLQEPDTGDLCDPEEGEGDEDTGEHDRQRHNVDDLDTDVLSNSIHKLSDVIGDLKLGIYLKDRSGLILNINTANDYLVISENRRFAAWTARSVNRLQTSERFKVFPQVISSSKFASGKHYWDMEGSAVDFWSVGMCYPSMDRCGDRSCIGFNNKSWSLERHIDDQYIARHDGKITVSPERVSSDRLRISLDYEAGQLSFYELCDPIRHLHTFTATFTEPLHVVFCIWEGYIYALREAANHNQTNHYTHHQIDD